MVSGHVLKPCTTFRSAYDSSVGYPQLGRENSRCKHLYFYFDHSEYGFMSIRLQTWTPYSIQIAIYEKRHNHRIDSEI